MQDLFKCIIHHIIHFQSQKMTPVVQWCLVEYTVCIVEWTYNSMNGPERSV